MNAPPKLAMLFWEATSQCNLHCAHCRRVSIDDAPADLTTAEARALLDSAAALGGPVVVFSGGEPLLRGDWRELADHASAQNLPTALATNGTLIDADLAREIAAAKFRRVAISLDGADAATHDAIRGRAGAFHEALRGLRDCIAADVPTQINATVTRRSAPQLQALADLARREGAVALHLFLLVPVGCGLELAESQQLPPEEYKRVMRWIVHHRRDDGLELRATCGPQVYRAAAEMGDPFDRGRGCLCGRSVVFVAHDGRVFPCGYLPIDCGSVRQQPLEEIWSGSDVFTALRNPDALQGPCGVCGYRTICGGCRARAYAATGNYLSSEPDCPFFGQGRSSPS